MEKYTYKQVEKVKNKLKYEVKAEYALYEEFENIVFKELAKDVKIPGFRPGMAPKERIEKEIAGDVLTKSLNRMLSDLAIEVLTKDNQNPLNALQYNVEEMSKEKGIIFTFEFYTHPEIDPAKFKQIKIKEPVVEVKDEEIDLVIRDLMQSKGLIPAEGPSEKGKRKNEDQSDPSTSAQDDKKSEEKNGDEEGKKEKVKDESENGLQITDEMVEKLGYEDEKTVDGLKTKVKETLTRLKKEQSEAEYMSHVVEEAVKLSDFDLPHEMVHNDAHRKEEDFASRLKQLNLDMNNYLTTQNKKIEDLREDWERDSEAQIRADLMLINLSVKENLVPSDEDLDKEIANIKDPALKQQYQSYQNRDYLRTALARDRGLTKLMEIIKSSNS